MVEPDSPPLLGTLIEAALQHLSGKDLTGKIKGSTCPLNFASALFYIRRSICNTDRRCTDAA